MSKNREIIKLIIYGLAVLILYSLLYILEDTVLKLSDHGRWYFIIPITAAFIFSFAHGNFTSQFWDILGIKAKKKNK